MDVPNPLNDDPNAIPSAASESGGRSGNGDPSISSKPANTDAAADNGKRVLNPNDGAAAKGNGPSSNPGPGASLPTVDPACVQSLGNDATGKREDYFKMWELNESEVRLIMATHDFAVWLDKDEDIDWQTTPGLDQKIDAQFKDGEISAVLNQVAELQSYPVDYLPANTKRNFRIMIGEGLARAFDSDPKSAMQMLDKAAAFAVARNQELARFWYLGGAVSVIVPAGLAAMLLWISRNDVDLLIGKTASQLAFLSCAGAFGAYFSILSRVSRVELDPAAGKLLHVLEGVARIAIGIMGSVIVLLAMRVGLVLSMLNEKGTAALLLVAFVAGASERLVPTVIKQVETSAASKNESVKGS